MPARARSTRAPSTGTLCAALTPKPLPLETLRPGSLVAHLDEDGGEAGAGALNPRSIYRHIVRCPARGHL